MVVLKAKYVNLILMAFIFVILPLKAYAFEVTVHSPSKVFALGFTTSNKQYGAAGQYYSAKEMKPGYYTFGVRVGGMFGTNVGCHTQSGKPTVVLTKNTYAILHYNEKKCTLHLYSK